MNKVIEFTPRVPDEPEKLQFFSLQPKKSIWYNASFRRYTVIVLGTSLLLGKGLGYLILSTEEISMYFLLLTSAILGSNYKSAVQVKANAEPEQDKSPPEVV